MQNHVHHLLGDNCFHRTNFRNHRMMLIVFVFSRSFWWACKDKLFYYELMQPNKTVQTDGQGDAALLTHHHYHFLVFNDSLSQNSTYLLKILHYLIVFGSIWGALSCIPTFPGCWKPNIFLCRPNMVVNSKKIFPSSLWRSSYHGTC